MRGKALKHRVVSPLLNPNMPRPQRQELVLEEKREIASRRVSLQLPPLINIINNK